MAELVDLNSLNEVLNMPFPAQTKQVAGTINGVLTDVLSMGFSDKILVTISQNGRLAHWLHVPLENNNPGTDGFHTFSNGDTDDSLLPLSALTATSILGGHAPGHETTNQLLARQIGSAIATKTPNEKRTLVVGLGLNASQIDRDDFFRYRGSSVAMHLKVITSEVTLMLIMCRINRLYEKKRRLHVSYYEI